MVYSCTVITSRCKEPLKQLADSPDQCTTNSSRRPTAVRSPTGETPSAKRNKEVNAIDEESATGKSSRRSLSLRSLSVDKAAIYLQLSRSVKYLSQSFSKLSTVIDLTNQILIPGAGIMERRHQWNVYRLPRHSLVTRPLSARHAHPNLVPRDFALA